MSIELKIKSKHLAFEPAIIRKEEYKLLEQIRWYKKHHQITDDSPDPELEKLEHKRYNLYSHRKWEVRNESRATYLARAFIKGMPYKRVENNSDFNQYFNHNRIVFDRVLDMVAKYGAKEDRIYKYWIKERNRNDYRPEEHKVLKEKIVAWFKAE